MDFNMKYNIFDEAKAVLEMKSPLETFRPSDIGTFVLAWSDENTSTSVRGTLISFGVDSQGEYAMVKVWLSGAVVRYTLVAPLPSNLWPSTKTETETKIWRDPDVKAPRRPL
jgi:hypothetical protein